MFGQEIVSARRVDAQHQTHGDFMKAIKRDVGACPDLRFRYSDCDGAVAVNKFTELSQFL